MNDIGGSSRATGLAASPPIEMSSHVRNRALMLDRLSAVDALSLHRQTSTMPAQTVALIVIEPSEQLNHERLHRLVASSLPQLAHFRSRLVGKPLGIGQPVWAEIDDYDPTPQIHRATLRSPGGWCELAEVIGALSAQRQRRRQPLWQAWSIDGLAGGYWGLAVTTSPLLRPPDYGAASFWSRLLTDDPKDDPADNLPSEVSLGAAPSLGELATEAVTEMVENQAAGMWLMAETVTGAMQTLRRRLRGTNKSDSVAPAASSTRNPALQSMFNAPITRRRAVAFAAVPCTDIETISAAFGGNTATVFLAACTISLRNWLQRYDAVPDEPVLMRVPLSDPARDPAVRGNPLKAGVVRLPVHIDDPVAILTNLHTATERLSQASRDDDETTNADFAALASLFPPAVTHRSMQIYERLRPAARRFAPICLGSVSYLSETAAPAYCAGAKVVGMHTAAPLEDGCGIQITLTSHGDVMDLCVCVCPDNVPGVDAIATGIAESVGVLVTAARKSPRGSGRSVVTEMTSHVEKRWQARRGERHF